MFERYQMYGLVRDGVTGKPRVDNAADLHPIHLGQMSKAEREELGVWQGDWALDAQGIKRVEKRPEGGWKAIDPLVAVSEIFDLSNNPNETKIMLVKPRADVQAGSVIPTSYVRT